MDTIVGSLLGAVKLGAPATAGSLTLIPIVAELPVTVEYMSLADAIGAGTLEIAEVDTGGAVPTLTAINSGGTAVLVVDGEELVGAKQNRVLNTTVLIGAKSEVKIPVSCVERGRWDYVSSRFGASPHISPHNVRHAQRTSVTASVLAADYELLRQEPSMAYHSDQAAVWREVDSFSASLAAPSPTAAMRDSYEQRREEIDAVIGDIKADPRQNGLLTVHDGSPVGFDLVSRPEFYAQLHDKLVRSYAVLALSESDTKADAAADERAAREFLAELGTGVASEYESPGLGISHRYTSEAFVGSALTLDGEILHAAFFAPGE